MDANALANDLQSITLHIYAYPRQPYSFCSPKKSLKLGGKAFGRYCEF